MKVEIDFPSDFGTNKPLYLPFGRLHLGDHVARIVLSPAGKLVLCAPKEAVEDGSIVLVDQPNIRELYYGKIDK
jgi:hypothetical protein